MKDIKETILVIDKDGYTWVIPRFFYPQPNLPVHKLLAFEDLK